MNKEKIKKLLEEAFRDGFRAGQEYIIDKITQNFANRENSVKTILDREMKDWFENTDWEGELE